MNPLHEGYCSLLFLPETPSCQCQALEGLFCADIAPSKGNFALYVAFGASERQGHCHVCFGSHGGQGTSSKTAGRKLDCVDVKNALFHSDS